FGRAFDIQMPASDVPLTDPPPLLVPPALDVGAVMFAACSNPQPTVTTAAVTIAARKEVGLPITNLWCDTRIRASTVTDQPNCQEKDEATEPFAKTWPDAFCLLIGASTRGSSVHRAVRIRRRSGHESARSFARMHTTAARDASQAFAEPTRHVN